MQTFARSKFFLSIATAVIVGVGTAYAGIIALGLAKQGVSEVASTGTFISQFNPEITYTASPDVEDPDETSLLSTASHGISARAYMVASLDRGNILASSNTDRILPTASIAKLVTAVVTRKLFSGSDTITLTSRSILNDGDSAHLRPGEKFTVDEILYPLLMVSSNDVADALASTYDSHHGAGKFVAVMNDWASSIGATHTFFYDASGLSPKTVSTANDFTLIARWIEIHDPAIFDITMTKMKSIRFHSWVNPSHFLNLSSYVGGKNGYTPEAGLTSVSLFTFGTPKRLYSVVLFGSKQRDTDTLAVLNKALK